MFVELLNKRQQSVLLHYALEVMLADSRIASEEHVLVETLQSQSQPGVEPEMVPVEDLADVFLDQKRRVAFLLELISVGYVDEEYGSSESNLIREIADALDIDDDRLATLESWVERQFALALEARLLMEE